MTIDNTFHASSLTITTISGSQPTQNVNCQCWTSTGDSKEKKWKKFLMKLPNGANVEV